MCLLSRRAAGTPASARFTVRGALALTAFLALAHSPLRAETPEAHVHVNNVHLSAGEVATLNALNCNSQMRSGNYWIDFGTGAWGLMGGPQRGVLACHNARVVTRRVAVSHRQ